MGASYDHLDIERFSPLGDTPLVVIEADENAARFQAAHAIVVGIDRVGVLPAMDYRHFDVLLTTAQSPPRPWVSASHNMLDAKLESFASAVANAPHAASVLRQVLRINEALAFPQALHVESLAYSALLGGGAFRAWRARAPIETAAKAAPGEVRFEREGDHVVLTLDQPDTRNAMTAAMRDALFDALAAVLDDPSAPTITLRGDGACFSTGGHLDEFGANPDLAQAHTIRTMRSIAGLIDELGARIEVVFHGACIGSGLEGPAAAAHRTAQEGAFFQLPELKMGLIPGAGGTVTIPRAIGRHRACAMMLGGARVSAATARDWGLVQQISPRP
jgi:enoyl-CoA hydratase/carnithine racemase